MNNEQKQYNLTLEPEMATDSLLSGSVPTLASVKSKTAPKRDSYSVGTIDESMLSEEEKAIVEQFANEIDISNVDQVVKYGVGAQRNISDFSVSILKKVKTYDMGEVGESLRDLTIALDATVEPEKKGLFGVFQKAKRGVGAIRADVSGISLCIAGGCDHGGTVAVPLRRGLAIRVGVAAGGAGVRRIALERAGRSGCRRRIAMPLRLGLAIRVGIAAVRAGVGGISLG